MNVVAIVCITTHTRIEPTILSTRTIWRSKVKIFEYDICIHIKLFVFYVSAIR